jgi:glycosyltransferase involved in cell wall biosynthesis
VSRIGIVIPTAFNRPEYLPIAYQSIANQQTSHEIEILVGCPADKIEAVRRALPQGAQVVAEDTREGLALKLDVLLKDLSSRVEYVSWLGDDDILLPGSLHAAVSALEADTGLAGVYGGCDYIDAQGGVLFTNSSGPWAAKILPFGPQLIPQPGSLMRSSHFLATGGLTNDFALAFDFDMFIKLKKQGGLAYVPTTFAQFRWHPTSLSVKRRMTSVLEASRVRRSNYQGAMRVLWVVWEPWVILATWAAGKLVSLKAKQK